MEWLNLHTSTLDSPEFIGADPTQRATWLCLLRYCAGQENGGTIEGGFEWADRKLQQLLRITRSKLEDRCQLWRRSAGDSIEVNFYPTSKEKQVRANRVNAMAGATARWEKREADATCHPIGNAVGIGFADAEGKEKEKGREEEGNTEAAAAPDVVKAPKVPKPPKATDADWLASLKTSPAYTGIDIEREHSKAGVWCETKRRVLSRAFFINWLNRADKPMTGTAAKPLTIHANAW